MFAKDIDGLQDKLDAYESKVELMLEQLNVANHKIKGLIEELVEQTKKTSEKIFESNKNNHDTVHQLHEKIDNQGKSLTEFRGIIDRFKAVALAVSIATGILGMLLSFKILAISWLIK